jgi:hypothetical protein
MPCLCRVALGAMRDRLFLDLRVHFPAICASTINAQVISMSFLVDECEWRVFVSAPMRLTLLCRACVVATQSVRMMDLSTSPLFIASASATSSPAEVSSRTLKQFVHIGVPVLAAAIIIGACMVTVFLRRRTQQRLAKRGYRRVSFLSTVFVQICHLRLRSSLPKL